jgi:hypothetical protein
LLLPVPDRRRLWPFLVNSASINPDVIADLNRATIDEKDVLGTDCLMPNYTTKISAER